MRLAVAAVLAAVVVLFAAPARADIQPPCPKGESWDLNRGACKKKKRVKKKSPEEKYYDALEHLEGRVKRADPKKGVVLLGEACTARLAAACTQLGFVHKSGRGGVPVDGQKAVTFYEQGCSLGDLDGCIGAADVHASGALGRIDHDRAVLILGEACDRGSGRACNSLAGRYNSALGVPEDKGRAHELYQKAMPPLRAECDQGNGASCDLVGLMYQGGLGITYDYAIAMQLFEKGCKGNAGDACFHLAQHYAFEMGVPTDYKRAYELYELACDRYEHPAACRDGGIQILNKTVERPPERLIELANRACSLSPVGCDLLAYISWQGTAVPVDLRVAHDNYARSCENGNAQACRILGTFYSDAVGVPKNGFEAVRLWEQACNLGDGNGCLNAGNWHYSGDTDSGFPVDQQKAYDLWHLGCLRDDMDSCYSGGVVLNDGFAGHPSDPARALLYFQVGCNLGHGKSCDYAGELQYGGTAGPKDAEAAATHWEQACFAKTPYVESCTQAAKLRHAGTEVTKDLAAAARDYTQACKLGQAKECLDADGVLKEISGDGAELVEAMRYACDLEPRQEWICLARGVMLRDGAYVLARDAKEAVRQLQASCERGFLDSCHLWGQAVESGVGFVADAEAARGIYTRACDGGHNEACLALATLLARQGKRDDAAQLYKSSCDNGSASACNNLGFAYYTGQGADWNVGEAIRFYEKSCELGEQMGCTNVAEMYDYGVGRDVDPEKAYALYSGACDGGFVGACWHVARYRERGLGGAPKDTEKALELYEASCKQDWAEACRYQADLLAETKKGTTAQIAQLRQKALAGVKKQSEHNPYFTWVLGTYHQHGVATVKAPDKAAELFVKACEGNDPLGCLDAGRMYLGEPGYEGVKANFDVAAVHLEKACAAGVGVACGLAEKARGPRPGPQTRAKGCGCDSGAPGAGGWLLVLAVAGLVGYPRRRRANVIRG